MIRLRKLCDFIKNRVHISFDVYPKLRNRVHVLATLLATLLATSCKSTEYIPVETVRTEYVDKVRELHDTLLVNDKETVYIKGDTVRITRYVDRFKVVHQRDTLCVERCDTISVPYPVERKLSKWEQAKMSAGGFALALIPLLLLVVVVIWKVKRKFENVP